MGREIVVIGGGNVAYDVARTVVRQIAFDTARTAARLSETANVYLVSLESAEEMPADTIEIIEGDEEGIQRQNGWGPTEIVRDVDGKVTGVKFRKCLRVYDEEHKFSPLYDENETKIMPCDTVLLAVGQSPTLSFLEDGGKDVELTRGSWIQNDPEHTRNNRKRRICRRRSRPRNASADRCRSLRQGSGAFRISISDRADTRKERGYIAHSPRAIFPRTRLRIAPPRRRSGHSPRRTPEASRKRGRTRL